MNLGGYIGTAGVLLLFLGCFVVMADQVDTGLLMMVFGTLIGAIGLALMINAGLLPYLIEELS